MPTQGGAGVVTDGLVLSLNAADPLSYVSGSTTWRDISGNGNNGTLTNGPTFSSANYGSVVFDGVNDYVNFGDIAILDTAFTQITVTAWINPLQLPPIETFFLGKMGAAGNRGFQFFISSSAKIQMTYFNSPSGTSYSLQSTSTISTNIFTQLTYTFTANTSETLYINGINDKVNTTSVSNAFNGSNSSNFQVGQRGDLIAGGYFNGVVSSIQIYNRALSATEVLQNFDAQKSRFGLQ